MKNWRALSGLLIVALFACSPLHDLDAASRGYGGGFGKGGAGPGSGGSSTGGAGASVELLCKDGALSGSETDVDCGGGACDTCARGAICNVNSDCSLDSCVNRRCQATHCTDNQLSPSETDVDCGGESCARCGVHQACNTSQDCTSNLCVSGICLPSSCDDGVIDGYETDLNCGGITCAPCRVGRHCNVGGDCETGICVAGVCSTATCANHALDAEEDGVDCGGVCPKPCASTCSEGGALTCASGGAAGTGGTAASHGGASSGGASSNGGTLGGSGGAAGGGGASGGSSTAGAGGTLGAGGGGGGTAGTPTTFPEPSCAGCVRLFVPLASPTDKANYAITLPAVRDFSAATITYRVYLEAGSGGFVKGYIQHSGSPDFLQMFQSTPADISTLGGGWRDIVWNVGAQAANYDKRIIGRVGIQVTSLGATKWSNPTIVYLDSVSVSGVSTGPWTFDQSGSVGPGGVSGPPNVLFTNLGDNPVSDSTATWFSK